MWPLIREPSSLMATAESGPPDPQPLSTPMRCSPMWTKGSGMGLRTTWTLPGYGPGYPQSPSGNDITCLKSLLLSNFTFGSLSRKNDFRANLIYDHGLSRSSFPMPLANKDIFLLVQKTELTILLPKCFFKWNIISGQTLRDHRPPRESTRGNKAAIL
jgi:hypothetical protein